MIVDDRIVIIGSANINDRSMLGNHDSEIAIIVQDNEDISKEKTLRSKMNGKPWIASKFAGQFRRQLYMEHLGLSEEMVADPLLPAFQEKISRIAKVNTLAYRKIFGVAPDDTVKSYKDYDNVRKKSPSAEVYKREAEKIIGHIVEFPLEFL
jgi:phospholipase D1/2